jgi:hypothetical protein
MCSLYRNEYRNLKLAGPPCEGDQGRVKRTDRDEPIGVVICICMETAQGISLCSYLYLKLAKMLCLSNYVFSSTKLENRRAEQVLLGGHQWGEVAGKGEVG